MENQARGDNHPSPTLSERIRACIWLDKARLPPLSSLSVLSKVIQKSASPQHYSIWCQRQHCSTHSRPFGSFFVMFFQPSRTDWSSRFCNCFSFASRSLVLLAQARSAAESASTHSPRPAAKTTSWNLISCRIGRPKSRRNAGKPRRLERIYCVWSVGTSVRCCTKIKQVYTNTYR